MKERRLRIPATPHRIIKTSLTANEMGRLGGLARARKLSARRRREIARKAAKKRWDKATGIDPELAAVAKKYI